MNDLAAFSFTAMAVSHYDRVLHTPAPHSAVITAQIGPFPRKTDPFPQKTDLSMTSNAGIRPLFMGMGHSITENENQVVSRAFCEIQPRGAPQQSA
ncbi:hypothetical protein AB4918_09545 [Bifidobacterium dentium]|uniref:hypothetical protein n=1 Tax=Bifidobacterium dentium TaxID=1689 RepID=UPI003D17FF16